MHDQSKVVVAFLIPLLTECLSVAPAARRKWPRSVVFIEPPSDPTRMTVVSIGVAPSRLPAVVDTAIEGAIFAVLPLDDSRSVQLMASYDNGESMRKMVLDAIPRSVEVLGGPDKFPDQAILFLHGDKSDGVPWLTAIPIRKQRRE